MTLEEIEQAHLDLNRELDRLTEKYNEMEKYFV